MTVLIVITAVLAAVIVLLLIPSELLFSFIWNEYERKTELKFKYLFIKITLLPNDDNNKNKKKKKKNTNNKEKKKYTFNDVKRQYKNFKTYFNVVKDDIVKILSYAKKHAVTVKNTDINIKFDFEDPMDTGIYVGVINGIVYNIIGILDRTISVEKMKIDIVPLFENRDYFDISVNGIVRIKNVHIMYILIKAFKIALKLKKISPKGI